MAANPDTDVVSGRIWQGKNPYLFTVVQYSTEFAIDGTSLCLEIITLEAFASPARLDGIISSRLPK